MLDPYYDKEYDDVVQLYYYPIDNVFVDGGGFQVFDIFTMITPNDLFLFKYHKHYMIFPHATIPGVAVEMIWPDDCEVLESGFEDYSYEDFFDAAEADRQQNDYMKKR